MRLIVPKSLDKTIGGSPTVNVNTYCPASLPDSSVARKSAENVPETHSGMVNVYTVSDRGVTVKL